jgi:hypothetical protein
MNSSNPYHPPATRTEARSWRPIDFIVVGLWLAIPVGVVAGRQLLLPVFEDFEVGLPIASQYLLSFYSAFLLAIVSLVVLLAVFAMPNGSVRRRFVQFSSIFGVLVFVVCSLSIIGPLVSLLRDLN